MNESMLCRQCGLPIPADAPRGVCPRCVFGVGLAGDPSQAGAPVQATQEWSSPGRHFEAPSCAQLAGSFPQLEILEFLGQGGMGAVYKVRQRSLERLAALKIIPTDAQEPGFSERFRREARALAKLTHPHIVLIFEFGETDQFSFFLMEYVDGVNLREALAQREITAEQALGIVPQICDALQYAHEEGIVHRDIKPENVLLDRRGRVKIADFGLAKLIRTSDSGQALTGTHQVMGTLHYMAPEQMEKPQTVDHRADIYSLGVVFYELLTGELPLGRFDPPSRKRPLDARLDEVVMRTLEKEPDRRYQHASELKYAVSSVHLTPAQAASKPPVAESHDPPAKNSLTQDRLVLPYSVDDEWGMSQAAGLLSFDGRGLHVTVHRKDVLGRVFRTGPKEVDVPVDDIATLESHPLGWRRQLHLVLLRGTLADTLPISGRGRFVLKIASEDAEACDRLAGAFRLLQDGVAWEQALRTVRRRTPEQLHPLVHVPVDRKRLRRSLSTLALALCWLGLMDLLLGIVVPGYFIVGALAGASWNSVITDIEWLAPAEPSSRIGSAVDDSEEVVDSGRAATQDSQDSRRRKKETDEAKGLTSSADAGSTSSASRLEAQAEPPSAGPALETEIGRVTRISTSPLALMLLSVSSACFGCLHMFAALKLYRMESWWVCLTLAILLLLPLHILFLFSLPAGIVMLVMISRRPFRAACVQAELSEEDWAALGASPPARQVPKPV